MVLLTRPRYALLPLTCLLLALVACSINPATGRRQFNTLSEAQEIQLGTEAAPQFIASYGGELPSAAITTFVQNLGARLAAESERPDLPWEFHVLNSPVINAFALPGGKVFMSRGLLEKMTNEAQLAGVLGHEIGHVTAQHIGQQMTQSMIVTGLGAVVGVVGEATDRDWLKVLGVGGVVGGNLYLLKFGRDQESQADELGVRYMIRLGYDPRGQVQVMEILQEAAGGGGGTLEILATHPLPQTRIDRLNQLIRRNHAGALNDQFHADRFETQVLAPLRRLPAAPAPQAQRLQEANRAIAQAGGCVCAGSHHEH